MNQAQVIQFAKERLERDGHRVDAKLDGKGVGPDMHAEIDRSTDY